MARFILFSFLFALPFKLSAYFNELVVIRDVKVDVTGKNGIEAKNKALDIAPEIALKAVVKALKPMYPDVHVTESAYKRADRHVRSQKVQTERITSNRYIAVMTYEFKPSIQALIRGADLETIDEPLSAEGIGNKKVEVKKDAKKAEAAAPILEDKKEEGALKTLVVPLYRDKGRQFLWQDDNPLKKVFADNAKTYEGFEFVTPYGDADDMADVGLTQIASGHEEALQKMAKRYEAQNVWALVVTVVRDAVNAIQAYDVVLKQISSTQYAPLVLSVPFEEAENLNGLVSFIMKAFQKRDKEAQEKAEQQANIRMTASVSNIGTWIKMKRLIGSVEDTSVRSVSLKPGRVSFKIRSNIPFERLKGLLLSKGVSLTQSGSGYRVSLVSTGDVVGYDAR